MRAVQVLEFGGPEVLTPVTLPDLVPAPGEAVVAVAAADVLHLETVIRHGFAADFFPLRPPYIPGGAVAGTVLSTGEGVDPAWTGRRVAARLDGQGGYASQVVVAAENLVDVPATVGLSEAAALLHDGPTALALFDNAAVKPGDRVLITGASGGLGMLLVQLVRAAGAYVIAGARGQKKLDLALKYGADVTVDLANPSWPGELPAAPDVVFDGVGSAVGRAAFEITAPGGRFSSHGGAAGSFAEIDPAEAAQRGVTVRDITQVQFTPTEGRILVVRSLAEAAAGRISPVIGQAFALADAAQAHIAIEDRTVIGKTLLIP